MQLSNQYQREVLNKLNGHPVVHLLPTLIQRTPAGASTKMVAQYFQNAKAGKFQKFDFGTRRNIKVC